MASNFARGHEMKDKQNGAWKKDVNVLYHELAVNSDHILNVLETVEFVFCLQITHLMYNELRICFTALGPGGKENFSFIVRSTRGSFVNKTLTTVSNP